MNEVFPELASRFDEIIGNSFGNERDAGLAAAVVVNGEIAWFTGVGYSDLESRRRPDQFTTSRVASITKTFTATAILKLRDAGMLELEDPLVLHIPEFASARALAGTVEGVTVKRLLTHHSGLSTETPLPTWAKPDFPDIERVIDAFPDTEIVIPQDSQWKYSNLGFGLLGEVVHRLTGKDYTEYVETEIVRPLKLDYTTFDIDEVGPGRMATGYIPGIEPGSNLRNAPYAHLGGIASAGQLHSNVHDLARWVGFHTGAIESPVLGRRSLDEMYRPVYISPDWSWGQALGWRAHRRGERVYLEHGGGIHGYTSQVVFNKPAKVGAITLANVWPPPPRESIAFKLLDAAIDALGTDTSETPDQTPDAELPPGIDKFLGAYFAEPYVLADITLQGNAVRLEPGSPDTMHLHAPCGLAVNSTDEGLELQAIDGRGAGERLDFQFGPDDSVTGFLLGGFLYERTG